MTCCEEFAATRRGLLRGALVAGTTATFGTAVVSAAGAPATAATAARRRAQQVLVVVSLRGAADGMSLVVPHADPAYYSARPRIALPKGSLVAADSQFGLHPSLQPMMPLWNAGKLAAVHAVGLPAPNRSHFSAMEEIEDANPGSTARQGWLNRLIGQDRWGSPLQGVAIAERTAPGSMYGPAPYMAYSDVDQTRIAADDEHDPGNRRLKSLHQVWGKGGGTFGASVRAAMSASAEMGPVRSAPGPRNGARYPGGDVGDALAAAARTIRGDVGVEVITVDCGDWDMHTGIGNLQWGAMQSRAGDLAGAINAFFTDLGGLGDRVTLVTISEFGRRVRENDNWGLDHGHGTVMFLAGAGVRGGYHGAWPGLVDSHDADLPVTTDYRSVLSEVVTKRFGVSSASVFPRFTPEPVGAMR